MTRRMRRTRRRTWVAAPAVLALLAAAWGDDTDVEGPAAPDEPAAEAAEAEVDDATPADEAVADIEVDEAALQALLDRWRTDVDAFGATLSIRLPGHDDIQHRLRGGRP